MSVYSSRPISSPPLTRRFVPSYTLGHTDRRKHDEPDRSPPRRSDRRPPSHRRPMRRPPARVHQKQSRNKTSEEDSGKAGAIGPRFFLVHPIEKPVTFFRVGGLLVRFPFFRLRRLRLGFERTGPQRRHVTLYVFRTRAAIGRERRPLLRRHAVAQMVRERARIKRDVVRLVPAADHDLPHLFRETVLAFARDKLFRRQLLQEHRIARLAVTRGAGREMSVRVAADKHLAQRGIEFRF